MRGPLNEGARQLLRLPLYVCISAYSGDDRLVLFLFRPLFTTCKVDYVSVVFLEISKKIVNVIGRNETEVIAFLST